MKSLLTTKEMQKMNCYAYVQHLPLVPMQPPQQNRCVIISIILLIMSTSSLDSHATSPGVGQFEPNKCMYFHVKDSAQMLTLLITHQRILLFCHHQNQPFLPLTLHQQIKS
ncbi:hypothetical protein ACHAXS_007275 [Conticribra weissflogii]